MILSIVRVMSRAIHSRSKLMAVSRYAYVRDFELPDPLLPETFIIFRLDGHAFHRFSDEHNFIKPNDERALKLMDHAAKDVMDCQEYKSDIVFAFGESDEYSFLLRKTTSLYNRRRSKILSTLTSLFTASYVHCWPTYFPDTPLRYLPSFDGRIVLYPTERQVRDYFSWRQVDTHINNLYNTLFWALVQQGGRTPKEAHKTLQGSVSSDKHEILFSRFRINYNNIEPRYRKGSVICRDQKQITDSDPERTRGDLDEIGVEPAVDSARSHAGKRPKYAGHLADLNVLHCDIIQDQFWDDRPWLLAS